MAFRPNTLRATRVGMVVLMIVASLPEIVCCCGFSSGLGWLTTGTRGTNAELADGEKAVRPAADGARKPCCCCAKKASAANPRESSRGELAGGTRCKYHLASPNLLSEARQDSLDVAVSVAAAFVACDTAAVGVRDDAVAPLLARGCDDSVRGLDSLRLCARIQSWQI
jgi:hypothetical protein